MAENNINEQLQGELSEEELNEIAGGGRIYFNKKYQVFVDPAERKAYSKKLKKYGGLGQRREEVPFKPEYLDGLDI